MLSTESYTRYVNFIASNCNNFAFSFIWHLNVNPIQHPHIADTLRNSFGTLGILN